MTDATSGGTPPEAGGAKAGGAKGPDELRRQIEQTRHQLGDTVEQLAAKADVKGRARARAADLRDKAGAMTVQLRSSAVHAGQAVQSELRRPSSRPMLAAGAAGAAAVVAAEMWMRRHEGR
ncbi:DUF3618 domain-containing protein [Streptomyces echinoruber]|uniref:DUF3618 domain-containing protein n=1 Tax=Streptomyces echinoruber TaxID=68898 RepID=A0A918VNH5_9ACTN|nr:DUF3618 domain-containing protein [Streptomyces echinoruber]GHA15231.1 hypothetical protein GCM10010389_62320 [Streptomyces echinoruber]